MRSDGLSSKKISLYIFIIKEIIWQSNKLKKYKFASATVPPEL